MQNMVLAISMGVAMLTLGLVVLRSRQRTSQATQLALGLSIGALAAAVALAAGADFVPDEFELALAALWVIAVGGVLSMLVFHRP